MDEQVPEGYQTIVVTFGEGPLGVTFRKNKETGRVSVLDIVPESQAINLDVNMKDEIWAVGPVVLGYTRVDDDVWKNLVAFMKSCRPLEVTFIRQPPVVLVPQNDASISIMNTTQSNIQDVNNSRSLSPHVSIPDVPSRELVEIENSRAASLASSPTAATKDEEMKDSMVPPLPAEPSASEIEDADARREIKGLFSRLSMKKKMGAPLGKLMAHASVTMGDRDKAHSLSECGVDLFKNGQRIHHAGEVGLLGAFALWHMQQKRYLVLLNDVLLIAAMPSAGSLEYESTVDMFSCKIRDIVKTGDASNDRVSFDLILDGEEIDSLRVVCRSPEDKRQWVAALYDRIFDLWGRPDSFAWKHTYILGSIHAKVVGGDVDGIRELIAQCDSGLMDYSDLEAPDDKGITPLGYAAVLKKREIAEMLLNTNPDVTVKDSYGLTALHWAALHLDYAMVGVMCDHVLESDADMTDIEGRSALFLACAEGKTEEGVSDDGALAGCIASLHELTADVNIEVPGAKGYPIHYVAASWQVSSLQALIKAGAYVRLPNMDGMSPLHGACRASPLRSTVNELTRILFGSMTKADAEELDLEAAIRTLEILLQEGARPNAKNSAHKSPLHILHEAKDAWHSAYFDAVELLVSFGARIDDSAANIEFKAKCPPGFVEDATNVWVGKETPDLGPTGLQPGCFASPFGDKLEKGHCAQCDAAFTLFKHKRKCSLCELSCCDECSKKKVSINESLLRSCDGCFNRANLKLREAREKAFVSSFHSVPKAPITATQKTEPESVKSRLFAGAKEAPKEAGAVSKTMSTMNEAYVNLQRRGELLSETNDKSEQLKNQSAEFANLAKALKEKQKSRWF